MVEYHFSQVMQQQIVGQVICVNAILPMQFILLNSAIKELLKLISTCQNYCQM